MVTGSLLIVWLHATLLTASPLIADSELQQDDDNSKSENNILNDLTFEIPDLFNPRRQKRNIGLPIRMNTTPTTVIIKNKSKKKKKLRKTTFHTVQPYSSLVIFSVGCTGFLISDQHVLTAAHCLHNGQGVRNGPQMKNLKVGIYNKKGRLHWIRVKRIFLSSGLKGKLSSRLRFDYAVLKLSRKHSNSFLQIAAVQDPIDYVNVYPIQLNPAIDYHPVLLWCKIERSASFFMSVKRSECASQSGYSGSPVIISAEAIQKQKVVGLLSGRITFRSSRSSRPNLTILKRFTPGDIALIKYWQTL